jgi:hypothetical protein
LREGKRDLFAAPTGESNEHARGKKQTIAAARTVFLIEPVCVLPVDINELNDSNISDGGRGFWRREEEEDEEGDFIERRDVFDGLVPTGKDMRGEQPDKSLELFTHDTRGWF